MYSMQLQAHLMMRIGTAVLCMVTREGSGRTTSSATSLSGAVEVGDTAGVDSSSSSLSRFFSRATMVGATSTLNSHGGEVDVMNVVVEKFPFSL
jgi:acid phosphatase family membrane protein YuiD